MFLSGGVVACVHSSAAQQMPGEPTQLCTPALSPGCGGVPSHSTLPAPRPTGLCSLHPSAWSRHPTLHPATAQGGCWPRGLLSRGPTGGCSVPTSAGLCAHNPLRRQPRKVRWPWWVGSTASPSGVPVSSGLMPSRGGRLHWRERRDLVGFGKTISENFCFMWEIGINLILCCILYLSCV